MLTLLKAMTSRKTAPWLGVAHYDVVPPAPPRRGPPCFLAAPPVRAARLAGHGPRPARGRGYAVQPEPDWACCGLTLTHAGLPERQTFMLRRNIDLWRKAGRPKLAVFCATCLHGLAAYADPVHTDAAVWEPGEAQAWRDALVPLSGLLRDTTFTLRPDAPARVLYHRPCHGANTTADLDLLRATLVNAWCAAPRTTAAAWAGSCNWARPSCRAKSRPRVGTISHPAPATTCSPGAAVASYNCAPPRPRTWWSAIGSM